MSKKLLNIVIEFLKIIFVVVVILSFGLIILSLIKYNASTLLDFESPNTIFLGFISIPKVFLILLILIFGLLAIMFTLNIIFQDFFKNLRK